jgi:hypothetical protein
MDDLTTDECYQLDDVASELKLRGSSDEEVITIIKDHVENFLSSYED